MISRILVAAVILLYMSSSYALGLQSYVDEQGRTVFTNLPAECVKDSRLTCMEYHPLVSQTGSSANDSEAIASRPTGPFSSADNQRCKTLADPGAASGDNQSALPGLDVLQSLVEVNRIVDQYFPGDANPEMVQDVRQKQEKILKMLGGLRNSADQEQKSTIDRAIEVLRSNMAR